MSVGWKLLCDPSYNWLEQEHQLCREFLQDTCNMRKYASCHKRQDEEGKRSR